MIDGGYLPKSKLPAALSLLQIEASPVPLMRLNCFQLTTEAAAALSFYFFKFENGRDTIRKFTFANMIFN